MAGFDHGSSMTRRMPPLLATVLALAACSTSESVSLQPGTTYTIRSDAPLTPCPGTWDDYGRLDGLSNADKLRLVLSDGGTTLLGGDSFVVVGFGSGIDAPIRLRSKVNGTRCWLSHADVDDLLIAPK